MSKTVQYLYDADEAKTFANLAAMVLASKQNVGTPLREQAEMVRRLTDGVRRQIPPGASLHPHEQCLLCGSVGAAKPLRVAKPKPSCHICGKPFHRKSLAHKGTPCRLYRGKWVHIACIA